MSWSRLLTVPRLELGAWLLAPAAAIAWYPAVSGVSLFPLAMGAPLVLYFLRPKVVIPGGLAGAVRALALFSLLVAAAFIVQTVAGVHVNRRMEVFIFAMNGLFGPLAFVLAARLRAESRVWLLQVMTVGALVLILAAIASSVGLNLSAFDKQGRLTLLLARNTAAPTSVSLVLGLLFVANLAVQPRGLPARVRMVLLVALSFLIYLLATRFVLLIVAGALSWAFLRTLRRGALVRLLVGGSLVGAALLYISTAGGTAARQFRYEMWTLQQVEAPLADRSLAIRVALWWDAVQEIPEHPLGYGYMTFVSDHVYPDPLLEWRGYNTHNEFLLQVLALGWVPPLFLLLFLSQVVRLHRARGTLSNFVPVLIGLGISCLFETFSNHPNAVNSVGLAYLVLAVTLPPTTSWSARPPHEVVVSEERSQRQMGEHAPLDH